MVLESTVLCVDNSEFMRNGDYLPTRIQSQQDAANLICRSKLQSNPENNVALMSMSDMQVHVTLTTDSGKLLSKLNLIQPKGDLKFVNGLRVAHLALKHRQSKNHKTRIVIFVGSPIVEDEKELIKLAKKLKKEKVSVDVVSFGEHDANNEKLNNFVNTLNGKDGSGSHLVTIPPGAMLSGAISSSPIVQQYGGGATAAAAGGSDFDLGFDPNSDPELALALRVSLEEQRQRQEEEARRTKNAQETQSAPATAGGNPTSEDDMLKAALAMSMDPNVMEPPATAPPAAMATDSIDISAMTEEEQIAYAMRMSMQTTPSESVPQTPMETENADGYQQKMDTNEFDESDEDVITDPEFLQSVLQTLPGVDPQSEAVQQAMSELTQTRRSNSDSKKEPDNSKKDDA